MAWENVFLAGPRLVTVSNGWDLHRFTLGLGDSSPWFSTRRDLVRARVGADGTLYLESDSFYFSEGYRLSVALPPSAGMPARIRDIRTDAYRAFAVNSADSRDPQVELTSTVGDEWTPDPVVFEAADLLGIYMSEGG